MQNKEERKVLLQISNLKQYFPVGKKGLFVKANDGISIDIYEGETFGLVGESGCGKSTLGRSVLQLYKQTDGRSMYFGRSIDEIAPQYAYNTFRNLGARKEHMFATRKKYEDFQAEYDKLPEKEQFLKHAELTKLRKEANDAMLDVATLVGGPGGLPPDCRPASRIASGGHYRSRQWAFAAPVPNPRSVAPEMTRS